MDSPLFDGLQRGASKFSGHAQDLAGWITSKCTKCIWAIKGPHRPGPDEPALTGQALIMEQARMGRALVGQALVGRALMGQALMGQALVGRALMGQAFVGQTLMGRALTLMVKLMHSNCFGSCRLSWRDQSNEGYESDDSAEIGWRGCRQPLPISR